MHVIRSRGSGVSQPNPKTVFSFVRRKSRLPRERSRQLPSVLLDALSSATAMYLFFDVCLGVTRRSIRLLTTMTIVFRD